MYRATHLTDAATKHLGADFAGVWFDNDSGRVKIGVAQGASSASARAAAADEGVDADTTLVPVKSTWKDLKDEQGRQDGRLAKLIADQKVTTGLDAARNAVIVNVSSAASADLKAAVNAAADRSSARVIVEERPATDFAVSPQLCSFPYCDRPLRGGVRIDAYNGAYCTAGFATWWGGHPYVVTAGHCAKIGGNWKSDDPGLSGNDRHATIGPSGGSGSWYYGGCCPARGDAGMINATGNWWDYNWSPYVVAWGNGPDPFYIIHSAAASGQGWYFCHLGATSSQACGTVQSLNTTVTYTDGTTLYGMTRTNACGNPGDSGGPVVEYNNGIGIWSGGSGTCPTGTVGYYQELTVAQSVIGFSTVTG
jgi:streptogrisin C